MSRRHWDIDIGGSRHSIELVDAGSAAPTVIRSDGIEHDLPPVDENQRDGTATFDLAGHAASVVVRRHEGRPIVAGDLPAVTQLWGGPPKMDEPLPVVAYRLVVDDMSQGTWVASFIRGQLSGWGFLEPGVELPEWPVALSYPGTRSYDQSR